MLPGAFWGTVTIAGRSIPADTPVTAWISDTQVARTTTLLNGSASVYSLDIPGDDPDTPEREGGNTGEVVRFKIGPVWAKESGTWESGSVVNLNLTADGLASAATRWIASYGYSAGGWTSQDKFPRAVGDVNGDGKADIVGFSAFGVEVSLSTGRGFAPRTRWLADFGTFQRWIIQNLYPRVLADVNGDGKADVVGFFRDGVWVSLSAGDRFLPKTRWLADFGLLRGWVSFYTHPRLVADVNGDGKADVVGFVGDGAYVALSTGSGFQRKTCWIAPGAAQGWRGFNAYPRLLGDVNGDGQADIVSFSSGGAYVALSTGSRFCPATLGIAAYGSAQGWMGQNLHPRAVGDVNGDRKADIVGFWQSGAVVSLCQ